jgi:hypothetical protein
MAATQAASGGGPVFARAAGSLVPAVLRSTEGLTALGGAVLAVLVPTAELVPAVWVEVVVPVLPVAAAIEKGAENTFGAVKSF